MHLNLVPRVTFEWLESLSKGSNLDLNALSTGSKLHSNTSNPFQMVPICIQMVRIPFQWLENELECFNSRSKGLNFYSNASSLVRMVGI